MKGGNYETQLIAQAKTEPTLPNSLSAPVTMYVRERMAGLNAMPPNDPSSATASTARAERKEDSR